MRINKKKVAAGVIRGNLTNAIEFLRDANRSDLFNYRTKVPRNTRFYFPGSTGSIIFSRNARANDSVKSRLGKSASGVGL